MLKAVLFDLDIGIHLNATLKDFGLEEVDVEFVKYMVGGGARELLRRFFGE